jgi:hypothetical protein
MSDVSLLIQLLQTITNDDEISVCDGRYDPMHPLVNAVTYLATNYLTGDDGAIYELKKKFHVYPLEQDRFGWLIGAIELNRGIIVFG